MSRVSGDGNNEQRGRVAPRRTREPVTLHTFSSQDPDASPRRAKPRFSALIARRHRMPDAPPVQGPANPHDEESPASSAGAGRIDVDVVRSPGQLRAAQALVRKRYAWRGYCLDGAADAGHRCDGTEREITVIATNDRVTVGTITLGLDGPHGLRADETHGDSVAGARQQGRRVCELTRLAVDERADSRAVLASLFTLVYEVGRTIHGVTDVFVEVNPRHVAFYTRVLGFVVAAGERFCERVRAPSVLLRLEVEQLEQRLRGLGLGANGRSVALVAA